MRKKTICVAALLTTVLLSALLLTGCDPYAGKRPTSYPGTAWTCTDPDMTFYVRSEGRPLLVIREKTGRDLSSAAVAFDYGSGFYIRSGQEDLLSGNCSFSPTELRVKVKKDELFGGRCEGETILFTSTAWNEADIDGMPIPTDPKTNYNLCGIWMLRGTDASGAAFTETMVLFENDTVLIRRETADQLTEELEGTWETENRTFTLRLSDGTIRSWEYSRIGYRLTLTGNGETLEYRLQ